MKEMRMIIFLRLQEKAIGLEGMKSDRMFFDKFHDTVTGRFAR